MSTLIDIRSIWSTRPVQKFIKQWRKLLPVDNKVRYMAKRLTRTKYLDPEAQYRRGPALDFDVLAQMSEHQAKGIPPRSIILFKVGDNYRIVQGHYELTLAIISGHKKIPAIFVKDFF